MGMTLYELNDKYRDLLEQYENGMEVAYDIDTGEIFSIGDLLDGLEMSITEKIDNTILYLKNLAAEEEAIDKEIANLTDRLKRKQKRRETLEQYLVNNLGDTRKLETPKYKLTVKFSERTSVPTKQEDIKALPSAFVKERVSLAVDKAAIKQAILSGATIPGCEIVKCKHLTY